MTIDQTVTELYRAIVADPTDLTVRLVYADALDERRGRTDAFHASFVRKQIEIGKRRLTTYKETATLHSAGPDYWTFSDGEYEPGDRVDVYDETYGLKAGRPGHKKKPKAEHYRLKVVKDVVGRDGEPMTVVRRDEFSVEPSADDVALIEETVATFRRVGADVTEARLTGGPLNGASVTKTYDTEVAVRLPWIPDAHDMSTEPLLFRYVNGAVERVETSMAVWLKYGADLVRLLPLRAVAIWPNHNPRLPNVISLEEQSTLFPNVRFR